MVGPTLPQRWSSQRHGRNNIRDNIQIVSIKKGELSMALVLWALGPFWLWVVASGAHLSIACSAAGPGDIGGRLRGLKSIRAVRRPDEKWSLPERERRADGW